MSVNLFLEAGLGNQLFMIFALVSYAIDNNIQYKIYSQIDKTCNNTKTYWNSLLECFYANIDTNVNIDLKLYKEPCFNFEPIPKDLANHPYDFNIKGFFQSEKYFKHNYEKIIRMMNLRQKQSDIKEKYNHLFKKKVIAVHFRIGDYIGLQAYHCIKSPNYYINALNKLEKNLLDKNEKIEEYDILYFCQKSDIEYVNKYIQMIIATKNNNYIHFNNFIKIDDDIPDYEQMLIMSLCDHFIIANSTFSWFGAYFSESSNKIVYYPNTWFGPALKDIHDTKDLCPSDWISIIQ